MSAFVQRELQQAFNWSCRMTRDEFNALCKSIRSKNVRLDPHQERQLPMSYSIMQFSLEETWQAYKKYKRRNPEDICPEDKLIELWDREAGALKRSIRADNPEGIYQRLLEDPQRHIQDLGAYTQRFQLACVNTYLNRKIAFRSYPTVMSMNFA